MTQSNLKLKNSKYLKSIPTNRISTKSAQQTMKPLPKRAEILAQVQADNSKKTDPRSLKPEYRIFLDAMQDIVEPVTVTELQDYLNNQYPCEESEFLNYDQVRHCLNSLLSLKKPKPPITHNPLTKRYTIKDEFKTNTVRIEYLPISTYCVILLLISVSVFVYSVLSPHDQKLINTSLTAVITGAFYVIGQIIGSEFKAEKIINKLKKD